MEQGISEHKLLTRRGPPCAGRCTFVVTGVGGFVLYTYAQCFYEVQTIFNLKTLLQELSLLTVCCILSWPNIVGDVTLDLDRYSRR